MKLYGGENYGVFTGPNGYYIARMAADGINYYERLNGGDGWSDQVLWRCNHQAAELDSMAGELRKLWQHELVCEARNVIQPTVPRRFVLAGAIQHRSSLPAAVRQSRGLCLGRLKYRRRHTPSLFPQRNRTGLELASTVS
jgi:hypothetical protein